MRRRLALLVTATTSIVVVAFLAPLALLVGEIATDRAVSAGTRDAQDIAVLVGVAADPGELRDAVDSANRAGGSATSVLLPDGGTLGLPLAPSPSLTLARSGRAFTVGRDGGRDILLPVETPRGRAVVRTVVPAALLHKGVVRAVLLLTLLGVTLVVVAVVVADRLARWTLRPVAALSATARRLAHGDLAARVRPGGPAELVEVCAALNLLADRIDTLLADERESVADLSHRLRTPLTSLRLEAHGLSDTDESARMVDLVAVLERTVDRVISEARRPGREGVKVSFCDAVTVVRDRVVFWAALAEDQGRPLSLSLPPHPCPVLLPAGDLEAVVDALLENVFAHTAEGTGFAVAVAPAPTHSVSVLVADSGPGFPHRDVTGRGVSHGGSTGLGLDIVRRAAEASGGSVTLEPSSTGGAQVRVDLGAAAT